MSDVIIGSGTPSESLDVVGNVELSAGTGTKRILAGGTLATSSTSVSCDSSADKNMWVVSIPANTLAVNGDRLYFESMIEAKAGGGSNTTIKVRFGNAGLITIPVIGALSDVEYYIDIKGYLVRYNGSSVQNMWIEYSYRPTNLAAAAITKYSVGYTSAETLTNTLNFIVDCQTGVTPDALNSCTFYRGWIDYMPAN